MLTRETRGADAEEAAALALPHGAAVHVAEGLSLADGLPVACFRSVFPADRLPDMLDHLADLSSVTAALKACGVADYTRASTRITARRRHRYARPAGRSNSAAPGLPPTA